MTGTVDDSVAQGTREASGVWEGEGERAMFSRQSVDLEWRKIHSSQVKYIKMRAFGEKVEVVL